MNSRQLRHELRHGRGGFLEQRHGIVPACRAAMGCMGLFALQVGIIKRLPQTAAVPPKWGHFGDLDAAYYRLTTVDASQAANLTYDQFRSA